MKLNRRGFFKIIGGMGAALAIPVGATYARDLETDASMGCLVDITRCIGCRQCEVACNAQNKLPHQEFDNLTVPHEPRRPDWKIFTVINRHHDYRIDEQNHLTHIYVKEQCRHCLKPACASACVVGALSKQKNGPVVYDAKKCIGCRYCMIACPFQIPAYEDHNALTPRVRKCTFCSDRIDQKKLPACATICPTQAIVFGRRDVLLAVAKKKIKENPGKYFNHIYGEHEVGGTSWLYLSPVEFTFFPKLGIEPPPRLTELILSGVFGYAAAPTALFAVLGAIGWVNARKRSADSKILANHEEDTP